MSFFGSSVSFRSNKLVISNGYSQIWINVMIGLVCLRVLS